MKKETIKNPGLLREGQGHQGLDRVKRFVCYSPFEKDQNSYSW